MGERGGRERELERVRGGETETKRGIRGRGGVRVTERRERGGEKRG